MRSSRGVCPNRRLADDFCKFAGGISIFLRSAPGEDGFMLTNIAYVLLLGLGLGALARLVRLPPLVGMLAAGILLGPCVLNLLSPQLLGISADLRQLALIIILARAGLSLEADDLRRAGRPAVLMCFVPASFEVLGMVVLAPRLLGVSLLDAAIMGAVVGAVSPAVIVPRMLKLMSEGYGTEKGIPQMVLAGASVDDVFVIVLFTSFTAMAQGGSFSVSALAGVPVSIVLGAVLGLAVGFLLAKFFAALHMRDSVKVVILLSVAFLLVALEDAVEAWVPFSGLLAVLGMGLGLRRWRLPVAERLTAKFGKLWVWAEVMLFVLVGAEVDLNYAAAGLAAVATVLGVLCFRALGVLLCVAGSKLTKKERLFAVLAYLPKATVQAAIGGVPLAMGLSCGQVVLTVAVIAILVTAPLGALAIDASYKKLLERAAD